MEARKVEHWRLCTAARAQIVASAQPASVQMEARVCTATMETVVWEQHSRVAGVHKTR